MSISYEQAMGRACRPGSIHDRARQLVAQGACVTASEAYSMLAKRRTKAARCERLRKPVPANYWWNKEP